MNIAESTYKLSINWLGRVYVLVHIGMAHQKLAW